jgi:anti-sigma regulatory factor (Ser/Thr protein kinase)
VVRRVGLADSAAAAKAARRAVAELLASCGQAGTDAADTVVLLTSEVVTNAITHAAPAADAVREFALSVRITAGSVWVEVTDPDPAVFVPGDAGATAEHGRGLFLVAALAKEWGVRIEPDQAGKTVWFHCLLDQ